MHQKFLIYIFSRANYFVLQVYCEILAMLDDKLKKNRILFIPNILSEKLTFPNKSSSPLIFESYGERPLETTWFILPSKTYNIDIISLV